MSSTQPTFQPKQAEEKTSTRSSRPRRLPNICVECHMIRAVFGNPGGVPTHCVRCKAPSMIDIH